MNRLERDFMSNYIDRFFVKLESVESEEQLTKEMRFYLERFLEFMIDLLTQLRTRLFIKPIVVDKHLVVRCQMSKAAKMGSNACFQKLLEYLRFYEDFEMDDNSAEPLTNNQIVARHYDKLENLQRICYAHHKDRLEHISMKNISALDNREAIVATFERQPLDLLINLCSRACFLDVTGDAVLSKLLKEVGDYHVSCEAEEAKELDEKLRKKMKKKRKMCDAEERLRALIIEIFVERFQKRESQIEKVLQMPLFPTEELIWDPNVVPEEHYDGDYSLALPKLNLQFLTIYDYLLRNFHLFRLESTFQIREDVQDAVLRMAARPDGEVTAFYGKARMACPLDGLNVTTVKQPDVGEIVPAEVTAELTFNLAGLLPNVREEWDSLREHDVIFAVAVDAPHVPPEGMPKSVEDFPVVFGIKLVRGMEIKEVLDEEGNVLNDRNPFERKSPVGTARTIRVMMDPAQYHKDLKSGDLEKYDGLNLLVRRRPKENNFKAVLETIRDLMTNSEHTVIPEWLHNLFLGYGDPGSARYDKLSTQLNTIDFRDTFVDRDHLLESYPDIEMPQELLSPPFKLTFKKQDDGK